MTSHKKLEIRYLADDNSKTTLRVNGPKDGLALAEVKEAAEKIMPVLKTARNHNVLSFDKAYIVETTVTELQ